MLRIVPEACQLQPDRSRGVIVIESDKPGPPFHDAFYELESSDAANLALTFATQNGIASACLNGNRIGPYPVNSQGASLELVRGSKGEMLSPDHELMQPAHYRVEYPVARPLR